MRTYPEYKDSGVDWIREIPKGWTSCKLKYVLRRKVSDGPHETPIFTDTGIPFLSVDGIQNGELVFEGCRFISFEDHNEYKKKCPVEKNDVLMGKAASIGKIARVKVDFPISVRSPLAILKPDLGKITSNFLEYILKSTFLNDQIENFSTSNTQKNISMDDIQRLEILFPSVEYQTQISDYLDQKTQQIDDLSKKTERKIELLKEQRSSLINQCVTKGLDPNVEMKESGVEWIGEIPKEWKTSKVKFVSNINGRIGYRGYAVDDIVGDGEGAITLSPSNIIEDKFDLDNKVFLSWEKYEESPEIKIYEDDILLVKTGSTIGKVCIVPSISQKMTINPQLVVLKNHKVNSRYLWFFMSSKTYKDQIFSSIAGGSTPTTSQENILNHYILDPPLPEQKQISDYLDEETSKIDQMVDTETKRIELLKEYRQSLISNVVTGKIDVRDEVVQ